MSFLFGLNHFYIRVLSFAWSTAIYVNCTKIYIKEKQKKLSKFVIFIIHGHHSTSFHTGMDQLGYDPNNFLLGATVFIHWFLYLSLGLVSVIGWPFLSPTSLSVYLVHFLQERLINHREGTKWISQSYVFSLFNFFTPSLIERRDPLNFSPTSSQIKSINKSSFLERIAIFNSRFTI